MKNSAKHKTKLIGEIYSVKVIGCGGTGSILAEHLCRLIKGFRLNVKLELWDGDIVEQRNVTRQNFHNWEVGQNKAESLALRLAGQFALEVGAFGQYVQYNDLRRWYDSLVISCTDTLISRKMIAWARPYYWLDIGNDKHHGQAIFGNNPGDEDLRKEFWNFKKTSHVMHLPSVAHLDPAILNARKTNKKARAGCADMPFAQQGFGVNAMAALAGATIAKQVLVDKQVSYAGIYFNVSDGRMQPRLIDQELFRPWKNKDGE